MCDVLQREGVPRCVTKCDRGRGSKLVQNSVTYFMDGLNGQVDTHEVGLTETTH